MTDALLLREQDRQEIVRLLARHLPNVTAWAYGSRVNGGAHEGSDLDIVLRSPDLSPIPLEELRAFVQAVRDSNIPILVEARDWARLPESFQREIMKKYVALRETVSDWKECKLNELGVLARGKSKHRPRYDFHLYGGKYPFIQTGEIKAARKYIREFEKTYSEAGLQQSKLWKKGTLCITIAANIAEIGILSFDACFPDSVIGFLPDKNKSDLDFIYYSLIFFQKELKHLGEGSVQDNINLGTFDELTFPIPPLHEQKAIASVLSSFDDKIDLLHRQNKTLEAMAEALFRQWFVEEEDWEEVELWSVIETTSGGTPSRNITEYYDNGIFNWVKSKELNRSYIFETEERISDIGLKNSSAKLLPKNSILVAMYGATVGEYAIIADEMTCNQAVCAVKPNKEYPYTFLFLFFNRMREEIVNMAVGSAQQNISQIFIKQLLVPTCFDRINEFHNETEYLFEKIKLNCMQIRTLEKLLDTLLPKLMSGEVRVAC